MNKANKYYYNKAKLYIILNNTIIIQKNIDTMENYMNKTLKYLVIIK